MHTQTKTHACTEKHPHKSTISYLSVHSEAFKNNVADLNTACYCVKLQGDNKIRHLGGYRWREKKNLTVGRSGSSTELERCLEHNSEQDL